VSGDWFMLLIAAEYALACVFYAMDGRWWMALTVLCYGVANFSIVKAGQVLKL
jgi:hypothetical protein